MNKIAFKNANIVTPSEILERHTLKVENEYIVSIEPEGAGCDDYEITDLSGDLILPGLVDLQVNGGGGLMFNEVNDAKDIHDILAANASEGTTSICPTLISDDLMRMGRCAEEISRYNSTSNSESRIVGMHLEGPFLNSSKRGGHSEKYLMNPSVEVFDQLYSACDGNLKIISLAPELDGARQVIEQAKKMGVHASLAHSNASYQEVMEAIEVGLSMGTHLFNAMTQFGSREPGAVGAILDCHNIFFGIIADGKHVHEASIRVVMNALGDEDRVFLVSDGVSPIGTTDKSFVLYGHRVHIKNGGCYTEEGVLAGSATPLIGGVKTMVEKVGVNLIEAVKMASLVPAQLVGAESEIGSIEVGKYADILICKPSLSVSSVFVGGKEFRKAN